MGLQVDLTAVGAYALLGVAVDELANTVVPLDAVLGSAGGRLVEQVGNAGCAQARMAALDAALADLVSRHRPPSPEVTWLAGQLGVSPGDQLVRDLAGYLGWSHRHLTERFRREVGAPPKRYARLQRFRGALRLLSREPAPPLAAVAAASGYYDQAHLNREFRVLAGRTPAEVAATNGRCEEVDFVQDEVLSGAYRQSR
jgi:transcriptional regulator GlxA family with amidase domain